MKNMKLHVNISENPCAKADTLEVNGIYLQWLLGCLIEHLLPILKQVHSVDTKYELCCYLCAGEFVLLLNFVSVCFCC